VVWQSFPDGDGTALGPINTSLGELLDRLHDRRDLLVVGEVPHAESEILRERGAVVRTGHQGRRDPLALARLGSERIARLGGDDLAALEPQYIHSRREAVAGA
jgi:hypothetical protein